MLLCDGVPLKWKKEHGWPGSLKLFINWNHFRPLLAVVGQYINTIHIIVIIYASLHLLCTTWFLDIDHHASGYTSLAHFKKADITESYWKFPNRISGSKRRGKEITFGEHLISERGEKKCREKKLNEHIRRLCKKKSYGYPLIIKNFIQTRARTCGQLLISRDKS